MYTKYTIGISETVLIREVSEVHFVCVLQERFYCIVPGLNTKLAVKYSHFELLFVNIRQIYSNGTSECASVIHMCVP